MDKTVSLRGSFPRKHLEKGKHTLLLPLDPEVERLIGMIVAYWGAFELRMNVITQECAKAMRKSLDRNWERQPFRQRKETFKTLAVQYADTMFPLWAKKLGQLADTAGDLHWKRNLVAHGLYEIEALPDNSYRLKATGSVKGKKRTIHLDTATLSKTWHDIAHLLGELMLFVNHTGATINGYQIVVPDENFLSGNPGVLRVLETSKKR